MDPLTAPDVDLRDFSFMPLEVTRLRDSELASLPEAEAFRVAVLSWCVAWHQVPAASLPDDDVTLARLLGFGRDLRGWKRTRAAGGMRGWVKCSDGRLYHPVVAQKANEAWAAKMAQRKRTEAATQARNESRGRIRNGERNGQRDVDVTLNVTESKGQGQGQGQGQGDLPPTPSEPATGMDLMTPRPLPAIDDQARWLLERMEPWARTLLAEVGPKKLHAENWPFWKRLVSDHGLEAVKAAAHSLPATERWDNRVEERLQSLSVPTAPPTPQAWKHPKQQQALAIVRTMELATIREVLGKPHLQQLDAPDLMESPEFAGKVITWREQQGAA